MPARSDDPLQRVTLNLYASDCEWLEQTYGQGWTTRVRYAIHVEVTKRKAPPEVGYHRNKRTLGDLT